MKKDQFSYVNVRALSHASLQKFRQSAPEPPSNPNHNHNHNPTKSPSFPSKPNIKYYSNDPIPPTIPQSVSTKRTQPPSKSQQQLKKKIKVLQFELKKKINDHCYLVKLFKTKSNSQLTHLDLYLQFGKLEEELEGRNGRIRQLEQELEESHREVQELLAAKNQHQEEHTSVVTSFNQKISKWQREHAKALQEKDNIIQHERRMREEKDTLLKEIRRKYEQSQCLLNTVQNELMQVKQAKKQIQKVYQQRIQNTRQDFLIRLQQTNQQLQKNLAQIHHQSTLITQLKQQQSAKQSQKSKSQKKLQAELAAREKSLQEVMAKLAAAQHQLHGMYEEVQGARDRERKLGEELERVREEGREEGRVGKEREAALRKEIELGRKLDKENTLKIEKYEKQLCKLQQKLSQATSTSKILTFQLSQSTLSIQKLQQSLSSKQSLLLSSQSTIESLQSKLYTLQRKSTSSSQRIKQLEKQVLMGRDNGAHCSRIQIQNYKCVGRLIELGNQILGCLEEMDRDRDSRNGNGNQEGKGRLNNTRKGKVVENEQPETVTECVDMLTKHLQTLIKKSHPNPLTHQNQTQQLLQQIICDIKSIFHAYNSYIQDDQLKGATRQYLQCLDSHDKNCKKIRNNYLQIIMERLISMIAIQSYTSENGLVREKDRERERQKGSRSRRDSLDNTDCRWEENQDHVQKLYVEDRPIIRQQRRKTNEQTQSRYLRNQSKKKLQKLITEPTQPSNYPSRKLEYTKQNYMSRINLIKPTEPHPHPHQYHNELSKYSSAAGDEGPYLHRFYGEQSRRIPAVKRIETEDIGKDIRRDRGEKRAGMSEAEIIQKKYFR